jgi:hypothetical protein
MGRRTATPPEVFRGDRPKALLEVVRALSGSLRAQQLTSASTIASCVKRLLMASGR